jgi:hypothetical protein
MPCQSCASLLAAYEHAVSLYTTSVREIGALDQADFRPARKKSLRQVRRERHNAWMAHGALMEHCHQDHGGFAAIPGLGNDFCLVSQRAEQLRRACRDADDALIAQASHHLSPKGSQLATR